MRDRHPTHGYDHSLSGGQIAAIKAKGGFKAAGKGALPKNVSAGSRPNTTNRVNNPKVPGAQSRALSAPMSKKQVAARPVPKATSPKAPTKNPSAPKVTPKVAPKVSKPQVKTGSKPHVNVGSVLGRLGNVAKSAVQTAVSGSAAEAVLKKGKH